MAMTRDETAHWLHKLVEMWRTGELEEWEWTDRLERLADRQAYTERRVPAGSKDCFRWRYRDTSRTSVPRGEVYMGDPRGNDRVALHNQYGRMVNTWAVNDGWRWTFHDIQDALSRIEDTVRRRRKDYRKAKEEEEDGRFRLRIWIDRKIRGLSWAKVARRAGFLSATPVKARFDEIEQELMDLSMRDRELKLVEMGVRRFNEELDL